MLIGRYLQWVETAPVRARIEAARTLVAIYTAPETPAAGRSDAELALFALLDDGAVAVRRALAEAVAHALDVPRPLLVALAQDHSSVAVPVLRFSPLLSDADLVDAAAIGDVTAQTAVALRPFVRSPVAAALAEVGDLPALVALCDNPDAELLPEVMQRMLARFGDDGALRGALLDRDDLDPAVRHELLVATAEDLTAFAADCGWMSPERAERVARESRERGTVTIAARSARQEGSAGTRRLAAHLRSGGHLTPALILRSLLSGTTDLLEAALVELSGALPTQVAGHVRAFGGLGFASLYTRAKMPAALLPAFRAALAGLRQGDDHAETQGTLRREAVTRVLRVCTATTDPHLDRVAALLRRFEAEALRDEARSLAASAWAEDDSLSALMPWVTGATDRAPQLTFQAA